MSWLTGSTTPSTSQPATVPPKNLDRPKKVPYVGIFRTEPGKPAVELVADKDTSPSFLWSGYDALITFTIKTVAERTPIGQRNTVREKVGDLNAYHTSYGFCAVIGTEPNYDRMTAQAILSKVVDGFRSRFTPTEIKEKAPGTFSWPELKTLRVEAQTAEQSGIAAVQKDLDETKVALHKTIESVLERGEKLDTLVAKSNELGIMSKGFYKTAKQQNSCCVVM